jgi:hypothetical protein
MKLSVRFDITNRAMGGVARSATGKQWRMLTKKSPALRPTLPRGEFERQADHDGLLACRSSVR